MAVITVTAMTMVKTTETLASMLDQTTNLPAASTLKPRTLTPRSTRTKSNGPSTRQKKLSRLAQKAFRTISSAPSSSTATTAPTARRTAKKEVPHATNNSASGSKRKPSPSAA